MNCYLKTVGYVQASYVIRKVCSFSFLQLEVISGLMTALVPRCTAIVTPNFIFTRTTFKRSSELRSHYTTFELLHEISGR